MSWMWIKGIAGVVCVLIGLVWIGQGINLLPGSFMSGQSMWAIIGLVVLVIGAWLLWSVARQRRAPATPR
jgi:glucose dehydrogenase